MSDNQALNTFDGLDYEEIEQAVMETARGRWFLTEFARRHKAADTAVLLDAIRRLEDQIHSMPAETVAETEQTVEKAGGDAQLSDESETPSDNDEIADKLDRTTQLVRRLRNSHKLIGEAADKPPQIPRPVAVDATTMNAPGDRPGFVGSDDDIFADDRPHAPEAMQPETDADTPSATKSADVAPAISDTLDFADIEMPEVAAIHQDASNDDTSDASKQQSEAEPTTTQNDDPSAPVSAVEEDTGVTGSISQSSPIAANPAAAAVETVKPAEPPEDVPPTEKLAAAHDEGEPAAKPKKRIVVIRRPADQPGDIPLAGSMSDFSGDSPSAA